MEEQDRRGQRHRMPVVFGPSTGPRQGPNGEGYDYSDSPRTTAGVSFLTQVESLRALLPPGCRLDGEPLVTVEHTELRELEWLAGRGYSMFGVRFPVIFEGSKDQVRGPFLAVLWENRPEPIMSGREELGFAKLYCELPIPRVTRNDQAWVAAWDNHIFATLKLTDLRDASPTAPAVRVDGMLHHRYLPRLGEPGHAEVEQMVISPASAKMRIQSYREGTPSIEFVRSTWEQLPTMHRIVNMLADLPIVEMRSGWLAETRGGGDLSDQRPLS
jgi:hypothetical protein